jgi:serine/threonine protein kinase
VHRDIKPENVMIQSTANEDNITLKLTDFGFAVFSNPVEGLKQVLGSPLYMAPELV